MKRQNIKNLTWGLAWFAVLILLASLVCIPANAGLAVSGAKYMGEIAPGETYIHTITVSTEPTDEPVDIMIDVLGFGQGSDKSYTEIPPIEDTGKYSARTFITLDTSSFTLKPGESKTIKAIITIPNDIGDGGRYAMINIYTKPVGTGQVSISSAIGAPMMVTIKGQPITETGAITDIKAVLKQDGKTTIVTIFKNTGNHHYYGATNAVTVTDAAGKPAASITLDPSSSAIIPGATVTFEAVTPTPLAPGTYTAESKVTLPSGTVLNSTKMTVEVAATPAGTTLATPAAPAPVKSAPRAGAGSGGVDIVVQDTSSQAKVKTTYTPGPSPLITCGVFAAVLLLIYRKR